MRDARVGIGDEVIVERSIPLACSSVISIEPGDLAVVETVGHRSLAVRIHGMRIVVSKADVVRARRAAPAGVPPAAHEPKAVA